MRKGKILRRASVLVGVVGISVAFAAVAWADAPGPVTIGGSAVRNADNTITVTLQGTWAWVRNNDCNEDRFAAGWAVDWNDANQPGNEVGELNGTTYDVGALAANSLNPQDNAVHYYADPPRCGERNQADTQNEGNWGPLSHTYAANTESINVCVVTYDVHNEKVEEGADPAPKAEDLVAGGGTHNKDNSVESKQEDQPNGQVCFATTIPVPPPNVSPETGGQAAPAPALAFTGSSNGPLLATGLGLLALGGLSVYVAKRRRTTGDLQG